MNSKRILATSMAQQLLKNMARIEQSTKQLFQERYPEIEGEIWQAIDEQNIPQLAALLNKLNELE